MKGSAVRLRSEVGRGAPSPARLGGGLLPATQRARHRRGLGAALGDLLGGHFAEHLDLRAALVIVAGRVERADGVIGPDRCADGVALPTISRRRSSTIPAP